MGGGGEDRVYKWGEEGRGVSISGRRSCSSKSFRQIFPPERISWNLETGIPVFFRDRKELNIHHKFTIFLGFIHLDPDVVNL